MAAGDFSRVEADALAQVAAGAHMLDVNAGIPLADEPAILARAVQLVQSITDVPLSIDSSIVAALAAGPQILLMDEPFGALDAFTREQMQELLLQVWQRTAKTVFLITHDIEEAVFLATDLILLAPNPGQIVERLSLDFGQRYAAGESARSIKSDPRFIETREHVLAKVFSQRSAAQRQERA